MLRELKLRINNDKILQIKIKIMFYHGGKFRNNMVKISGSKHSIKMDLI